MDKLNVAQQEKDDNKYNRKYAVMALTLEILRNASGIMTALEAKAQAEAEYDKGIRAVMR